MLCGCGALEKIVPLVHPFAPVVREIRTLGLWPPRAGGPASAASQMRPGGREVRPHEDEQVEDREQDVPGGVRRQARLVEAK